MNTRSRRTADVRAYHVAPRGFQTIDSSSAAAKKYQSSDYGNVPMEMDYQMGSGGKRMVPRGFQFDDVIDMKVEQAGGMIYPSFSDKKQRGGVKKTKKTTKKPIIPLTEAKLAQLKHKHEFTNNEIQQLRLYGAHLYNKVLDADLALDRAKALSDFPRDYFGEEIEYGNKLRDLQDFDKFFRTIDPNHTSFAPPIKVVKTRKFKRANKDALVPKAIAKVVAHYESSEEEVPEDWETLSEPKMAEEDVPDNWDD